MPRPRTISDEQIKAAARACFLAEGPDASLVKIAESLGVTQPALFKRVANKKELLIQALCPEPLDVRRLRTAPRSDAPAIDQLVKILLEAQQLIGQGLSGLILLRSAGIYIEDVVDPAAPLPPMQLRGDLAAWIRRAFEGSSAKRAGLVADALISTIEARCLWSCLKRPKQAVDGMKIGELRGLVTMLVHKD